MKHSLKSFKKYLSYHRATGQIFWVKRKNSRTHPGVEAGSLKQTGYRSFNFDSKTYQVHRVVWLFEKSKWPNVIDHIDGNKLNNHISNLRSGSTRDNQNNTHRHRSGKLVGASYEKSSGKWICQLHIKNKVVKLGRFKTEREANARYLQEKARLM